MSYSSIDPVIDAWKIKYSLHVLTRYQDSEVRSTHILDSSGRQCQVWIDEPVGERVSVNAWDYGDKSKEWITDVRYLDVALDEAVMTARRWLILAAQKVN